jgi:rubrerythrin
MKNEAFSYVKYTMYAEQARKNGNETLAGVLEHTAADEYEKHFKEHAKLYGLLKSDHENLVNAMSTEFVESTQMYQDMAKRAEAAGDASVAKHFADQTSSIIAMPSRARSRSERLSKRSKVRKSCPHNDADHPAMRLRTLERDERFRVCCSQGDEAISELAIYA